MKPCGGVCGGNGQWECTECKLWSEKHSDGTVTKYAMCAASMCMNHHDAEMRGHPAHRWKELARTDYDEYMRQVFGRGGPQKPESVKQAEDEVLLHNWIAARDKRHGLMARSANR